MNGDLYNLNKAIWECRKCERFDFASQPGYFSECTKILFIARNPGQLYVRKSGWSDFEFINLENFDSFQKGYSKGILEAPIGKFIMSILPEKYMELWSITNIAKCRTPNDSALSPLEIDNCRPFLQEQILLCKPLLIVTMGGPAFNWWYPELKLSDYVNEITTVKLSYATTKVPLLHIYHPSSFRINRAILKNKVSELVDLYC